MRPVEVLFCAQLKEKMRPVEILMRPIEMQRCEPLSHTYSLPSLPIQKLSLVRNFHELCLEKNVKN